MEIVRQGRDTMLIAGVPRSRGTPVHFEHQDDTAVTTFDKASGKVLEVHTPPVQLIRIHELMHARHTSNRRYGRMYREVEDIVGQIIEDVRIHTLFWPWHKKPTPDSVANAMVSYMKIERDKMDKACADDPSYIGSWPDFATRLRMAAVLGGDNGCFAQACDDVGFATDVQAKMARKVIYHVQKRHEDKAAIMVATVFDKLRVRKKSPFAFAGGGGDGFSTDFDTPIVTLPGFEQPEMEIIELPKTEHCEGTSLGMRRATMGSRMYRPALRRPLLPQRLFLRRTPAEPGGTILIDASGSMGDFGEIARWVKRAPFGTIAYYAGNGGDSGWLYIFARDGRCAEKPRVPPTRGNTVDGPALTWLMAHPAPRVFVTDRGFCDAQDSDMQVARLNELERTGQVTVVNYQQRP
jgi:hypothetical protein